MSLHYYFLCIFMGACWITSSLMVLSKNPLNACLFLIATFFSSSCILFLAEADYLPIIFILIYVGAIMVLFLFVIMMLNLRSVSVNNSYNHHHYLLNLILLFVLYALQLSFGFKHQIVQLKVVDTLLNFIIIDNTFILPFDTSWQFILMSNIGAVLYSKMFLAFILAAFGLLLAMVGTISLTLKKTSSGRTQQIFKQVLRANSLSS